MGYFRIDVQYMSPNQRPRGYNYNTLDEAIRAAVKQSARQDVQKVVLYAYLSEYTNGAPR